MSGEQDLRIHVCMREPFARPGGLHSYVRGLVKGQEALGLGVVVLDQVTATGRFHVAHGTERELRAARPESALLEYHFAHSALPLVHGAAPRSWRALRRVCHFHGPWSVEGRVGGDRAGRVAAKRTVERLVYRRFGEFITASDAFRHVLVSGFDVPAARVATVHPGVDTRRFTPAGSRAEARSRLGLPPDGPLMVAVRRLEPRMGLETAIRAMAWLPPELRFAIAGQGSSRGALERLAQECGVGDRVVFLGRVSDELLPSVYRAGDVSVVPTADLEGFGMVVLESMACGTPVVATRVGGLTEAMGPFAERWTVDPGDPRRLAGTVTAALADRALPEAVTEYARSRSFPVMAQEMERAFASLARRTAPDHVRGGAR